jgi:hypothetical protein
MGMCLEQKEGRDMQLHFRRVQQNEHCRNNDALKGMFFDV